MQKVDSNIINEIIVKLSKMGRYIPKNKKTNFLKKTKISSFTLFIITLVIMVSIVSIEKIYGFSRCEGISFFMFVLDLINLIFGIIFSLSLFIAEMKSEFNLKKNFFTDLSYENAHDRQNAEQLKSYSTIELNYVLKYVIEQKIDRINARIFHFFGGKTAVISIFSILYILIREIGGLNKLGDFIAHGFSNLSMMDILIIVSMLFILGMLFGVITLKYFTNRLQYIKEIIEMAIKEKYISNLM